MVQNLIRAATVVSHSRLHWDQVLSQDGVNALLRWKEVNSVEWPSGNISHVFHFGSSSLIYVVRSDYGYGDAGSPPKIPGGATLVFEIELLSFQNEKDITKARDGGVLKVFRFISLFLFILSF